MSAHQGAYGEYRLQPGDTVDVRHPADAGYDIVAVLAPDGTVGAPGLQDRIRASGRTLPELQADLGRRYRAAGLLRDPSPAVLLRRGGRRQAFVGGEVQRPGPFDLNDGPRSVMQVLMGSGGPAPTAELDRVLVVRTEADGCMDARRVDVGRIIDGSDLGQNVMVGPQDVVIVPKSTIATVDLWVDQYIRKATPVPLAVLLEYTNNPASAVLHR